MRVGRRQAKVLNADPSVPRNLDAAGWRSEGGEIRIGNRF